MISETAKRALDKAQSAGEISGYSSLVELHNLDSGETVLTVIDLPKTEDQQLTALALQLDIVPVATLLEHDGSLTPIEDTLDFMLHNAPVSLDVSDAYVPVINR